MIAINSFFYEVIQELKKVTWPSRGETLKMTAIVIMVTVIVGVYVGLMDLGITKVLETLIK